jgi:hypothetical protein
MFIAQVLWATRFDLKKKMVWPLTVIRGVGKCATSRHEFEPSFFLSHISTLLWPPPFNLLSYPPDPDYRTHRTTRDKAPPKGRPFSPPPLEVHEWGAAVTQGALYAPPRLRMNGALPFAPFAEHGKVRDPPRPLIAR